MSVCCIACSTRIPANHRKTEKSGDFRNAKKTLLVHRILSLTQNFTYIFSSRILKFIFFY